MRPQRLNKQLVTERICESEWRLKTTLKERPLRETRLGEILVEVVCVPMHGSFWLATHPLGLHPRRKEFLSSGSFVFGNGGVGRVIESKYHAGVVQPGDYVAVFGHAPCDHYDCYACTVLHRYVECDFREATILGHGNGANDGMFGQYVFLPPHTWDVCFRADESQSVDDVSPYMFAFLIADVRNALTRHPDSLRNRRMMIFGAGNSGHIAAYIHLHSCPESKILAVDVNASRLKSIQSLAPNSIACYHVSNDVAEWLNGFRPLEEFREQLDHTVYEIAEAAHDHFNGRAANLLFDCSSGNTSPLWSNRRILAPTTHCIVFGFGSEKLELQNVLLQQSGLNILMSRGVGNLRNRRETIELLRAGAGKFVKDYLISPMIELRNLEECAQLIEANHNPVKAIHHMPYAYIISSSTS